MCGDGTPMSHTAKVDSTPIKTISNNCPSSQSRSAAAMPSKISAARAVARRKRPDHAAPIKGWLRRQIGVADQNDNERFDEPGAYGQ